MRKASLAFGSAIILAAHLAACSGEKPAAPAEQETVTQTPPVEAERVEDASATHSKYLEQPLVTEIFTADPSVHVWDDGRIYVYPSHDYDAGIPEDDLGSQYAMRDYIVLSMDEVGGDVTIHDVALDVDDVPWAAQQMWAPDAAHKDGKYYLYFPAKDENGVFHIGAAVSDSPTGPFTAESEAIEGSFSMDPAVFEDDDGEYYMYFGGIWGGQLQRWATGEYNDDPNLNTDLVNDDPLTNEDEAGQPDDVALMPKIAKMADDMVSFAEPPKDVMILDENGDPVKAKDHDRRFFEAAWVNRIGDTYYLSYSTGDTHKIVYATGDSPYGPFTYQGVVNQPVEGWTNHHSIFQHNGKWYLAYHDVQLSGKSHLRNVKITELTVNDDGTIEPVNPMPGE
ncbi:glycoside hydrolase family 43 protein [Hyphomonas pacifica]|uniref:Uncharacterized protein n=1 Tax=Hyphomonas pacifica TaxID=1280941 RepID=A0A062U506_9PROT|nr:glycoside hydrolase family 43 protein [Hyphomonas pacifica]KCZ51205.1 hypothetical protein HY2_12230 [Hyphomonas pacifica]RAN33684.1 hypothetical protein HY3_12330 [Hyphomonas pacifica]